MTEFIAKLVGWWLIYIAIIFPISAYMVFNDKLPPCDGKYETPEEKAERLKKKKYINHGAIKRRLKARKAAAASNTASSSSVSGSLSQGNGSSSEA